MTRPGRVAWLAVLALPVLAFVARLLLAEHDDDARNRPERNRIAAAVGPTVWSASGELDGVGRVAARLAPMHADPARQAFEAKSLRARIAGLAGDPFLIQLDLESGERETTRLDPARIRVDDDAGTALRAFEVSTTGGADAVAALISTPPPIATGERASFLLFGREPGLGARVVVSGAKSLPLVAATAEAGAGDAPVASIDRRQPRAAGSERR